MRHDGAFNTLCGLLIARSIFTSKAGPFVALFLLYGVAVAAVMAYTGLGVGASHAVVLAAAAVWFFYPLLKRKRGLDKTETPAPASRLAPGAPAFGPRSR